MPREPRPGDTERRGYGAAHQQERERWRPKVDAGLVNCARCSQPIQPGRPWDLGHTDDRSGWQGPEHRHCNRRAGGANGARVTNTQRTTGRETSRDW
jgi:hypothetical protein